MSRPWHIWSAFVAALAVALAALIWISLTVVRLDADARRAEAEAALEEDVRLSLWRIDTALASLIAQENARPFFTYDAFYAADAPTSVKGKAAAADDQLAASPLLTGPTPHVRLHFQMDAAGDMASPQAPTGEFRALAEGKVADPAQLAAADALLDRLCELVDRPRLLAALPDETAPPTMLVAAPVVAPAPNGPAPNGPGSQGLESTQQAFDPPQQQADLLPPQQAVPQPAASQQVEAQPNTPPQVVAQSTQPSRRSARGQQALNDNEYQQRAAGYQQLNTSNWIAGNRLWSSGDVHVGVIQPVWIDGELLLARRVSIRGQQVVQGAWVNWPELQLSLLADVHDLLPAAALAPLGEGVGDMQGRLLASLPIRLLPGPMPIEAVSGVSPLILSLFVAWGGVGLAAVAVAALLAGVVALSERRAAFVSAVTHELRTPLTTFRMYAEMLAGGMVPSEDQRRTYLNTLRVEADRLSHLVENVLSYARLERGRQRNRLELVAVSDLLDRVGGRLRDRADQAGMTLDVQSNDAQSANCRADPSVVEQILFNLVDNACKYGRPANAGAGGIRLSVAATPRNVELRVADDGSGITPAEGRKLFRPFSKSAHEAARTAPGVGLGLALSRRLARDLGGDLRLEYGSSPGATFVLSLRRS